MTGQSLRLRQKTFWNGFAYDLLSPSGDVVGGLSYPAFSQAKNARLAIHPPGSTKGDIALRVHGKDYLLRHEYTRRGYLNDIRYTLESPAHDVICSADITFESGRRLPVIRVTAPIAAEVMPSTSLWRRRFPIVDPAGIALGEVCQPRAFMLRTEYVVRMPSASPPLQAFVLALVLLARR